MRSDSHAAANVAAFRDLRATGAGASRLRSCARARLVAACVSRHYPDAHVRPLKRPWLVLAIAVAVVALPAAASGALSSVSAAAANSATFQDSTGEDPASADITTITVSNDDAATITLRINTPNRPSFSQDMGVFVDIDSDANQATGDPQSFGADHLLAIIQGEAVLFRWDGSDYVLSATQASLSYSWAGGATVRINAADLNNTRKFSFAVQTVAGIAFDPVTGAPDCTNCHRDFAPTIGLYTYQLQVTKPTLVVKSLKPTPARPAAGKPFTLRLVAARSDTGAVVQNGRVTCAGRLGSARVKAQVQRVQGGAATCTWNLPATAKGKTFRGTVTVAFEGLKASQSYTGKVR